jgi:TolB protein
MRSTGLTLIVLLAATIALAETDVRLRVTTEGHALIKLALAEPVKDPSGDLLRHYREFMETLREDLEMTGYFELLRSLEEGPQAIVETSVAPKQGDLSFTVSLTDKTYGASIFRRRYGASAGAVPMTAHRVADDIVHALTGRKGIANTHLAFVAGSRGESHIYSVHIDGSRLERLTGTPGILMSPSWSPEGTRLAYVSYETGRPAVYVVDVSGGRRTRFAAFEGMNATPAWSPDGKQLAVTLSKDGNPEVYILATDGSTRRRITYFSGIDCSPTWAPNGLELAFTSDRAGTPQIFITDAEGLNTRRLTFDGSYNTSPAWSPQGDLVAYVARIDGHFQICTIDPFGITTRVLTTSGDSEDPAWSPDGMHIVFSWTGGEDSGIYVMNKDGSARRRINTGLENPRSPVWSPRRAYSSVSVADGGD